MRAIPFKTPTVVRECPKTGRSPSLKRCEFLLAPSHAEITDDRDSLSPAGMKKLQINMDPLLE